MGGRTVAVQPCVQIVERIVACVTAPLRTPGVSVALALACNQLIALGYPHPRPFMVGI